MPIVPWLRWQRAVDFIVLGMALYTLLLWARETRALRFAVLIVALHAGALFAARFDLTKTSWLFDGTSVAVIGLTLLLFQDKLRRSLRRLDHIVRFRFRSPSLPKESLVSIATASFAMARRRVGSLIVLARRIRSLNLAGLEEGTHSIGISSEDFRLPRELRWNRSRPNLSRAGWHARARADRPYPAAAERGWGAKVSSPVSRAASTTTVWPSRMAPSSSSRPSRVSIFF